jgi:hypothetical protein
MTHRPGATRDEYATVVDRSVGEQAAVSDHKRDTQGRGLLKADALRHTDRLPAGRDHTLRGCPSRPLPGGVVDPHASPMRASSTFDPTASITPATDPPRGGPQP